MPYKAKNPRNEKEALVISIDSRREQAFRRPLTAALLTFTVTTLTMLQVFRHSFSTGATLTLLATSAEGLENDGSSSEERIDVNCRILGSFEKRLPILCVLYCTVRTFTTSGCATAGAPHLPQKAFRGSDRRLSTYAPHRPEGFRVAILVRSTQLHKWPRKGDRRQSARRIPHHTPRNVRSPLAVPMCASPSSPTFPSTVVVRGATYGRPSAVLAMVLRQLWFVVSLGRGALTAR
jgi:hypothetical protein